MSDSTEKTAYEALSLDPALRGLVPHYHGSVAYKDHTFIELQDLLHGFSDPHVIDVKMGTRTFLESEVGNPTARADLYQKMVALDASAPTPEEHAEQAVTKVSSRAEQSSVHPDDDAAAEQSPMSSNLGLCAMSYAWVVHRTLLYGGIDSATSVRERGAHSDGGQRVTLPNFHTSRVF